MISKQSKMGDIVIYPYGKYKITNIYQVSDEYMKKYNLWHKNRVTIEKIKGEGAERYDFAIAD